MLVLVLATVTAGGYLYVTHRGSPGLASDFVSVSQRAATSARSLPVEAKKVQRFDELSGFANASLVAISDMTRDQATLAQIATTETGPSKRIAEQAAAAASQAITAATDYRHAVAFTYDLSAADQANATLTSAAATLDQAAAAWQRS